MLQNKFLFSFFLLFFISFLSYCLIKVRRKSLPGMSKLVEETEDFRRCPEEAKKGPVSSPQTRSAAFIFLLFQHTFLFCFLLELQPSWKDSLISYFSLSTE